MKLLSAPASPFARKVRIVLAEKRIDCDIETVDVQPQENPVNAHNPLGKIPTLVLDDGTAIYDSRVIVEFLDNMTANNRLIPKDNRERIAVRRWEALADGVLDAGLLIRYESLRPAGEQSAAWIAKQTSRVRRGLAQLQSDLGAQPWCQGERYTLADVALGCCLGWIGFRKPAGIDWRAGYEDLAKHYDKLMERPAFADTVPAA
ncbi:MAG: glutathione S-transferase N-terminal domain-containing protein [Betaproteobacteria bacterium]|nr:glutathione S-transferase N-terminal domain-containing protein [Betaproteobacteria bacterium]